jgi:rubrerythrin
MDEDKLLSDFNTEIDQAFQNAWHSEKGGDEKWNNILNTYGVIPLTKEEKDFLLNSEMKITRGAFPIELRRVFEVIIQKNISLASSSQKLTTALNNFNMEAKVLEYYQKIKHFSGLGDIFKNAATGTQKYSSGLQKEKQKTMTCKNCGAPRLDEMQYDNCLFCGSKLFEIK